MRCSYRRPFGPNTTPPWRHWGDRVDPWRARPVPFWRHGFAPPPATRERFFVALVAGRATARRAGVFGLGARFGATLAFAVAGAVAFAFAGALAADVVAVRLSRALATAFFLVSFSLSAIRPFSPSRSRCEHQARPRPRRAARARDRTAGSRGCGRSRDRRPGAPPSGDREAHGRESFPSRPSPAGAGGRTRATSGPE